MHHAPYTKMVCINVYSDQQREYKLLEHFQHFAFIDASMPNDISKTGPSSSLYIFAFFLCYAMHTFCDSTFFLLFFSLLLLVLFSSFLFISRFLYTTILLRCAYVFVYCIYIRFFVILLYKLKMAFILVSNIVYMYNKFSAQIH